MRVINPVTLIQLWRIFRIKVLDLLPDAAQLVSTSRLISLPRDPPPFLSVGCKFLFWFSVVNYNNGNLRLNGIHKQWDASDL